MDTLAALWAFHKANIILTAVAAVVFVAIYEPAAYLLRRYLRKKYP